MISRYSSIYIGAEKMSVVTLYQREFSHFVEAKPVWIFKKSEVSIELLKETIIASLNESRVMSEKEYQINSVHSDLRKLLKVPSYKQLRTYKQFIIELSNDLLILTPLVYQPGKRWRTEDHENKCSFSFNEFDSLVDLIVSRPG